MNDVHTKLPCLQGRKNQTGRRTEETIPQREKTRGELETQMEGSFSKSGSSRKTITRLSNVTSLSWTT